MKRRIGTRLGVWLTITLVILALAFLNGMHRFFVVGPVDNLDKNVIAALFLYKDDQTEMDIEFARWGEANPTYNAQYVVQPWDRAGNREQFSMILSGSNTTHYIDWSSSLSATWITFSPRPAGCILTRCGSRPAPTPTSAASWPRCAA